jgi:hypothetical protein
MLHPKPSLPALHTAATVSAHSRSVRHSLIDIDICVHLNSDTALDQIQAAQLPHQAHYAST